MKKWADQENIGPKSKTTSAKKVDSGRLRETVFWLSLTLRARTRSSGDFLGTTPLLGPNSVNAM